jgi:hypothetical protein
MSKIWRNADEGWVEKEIAPVEEGIQARVSRNIHFSSSQLPKNWKYHEGGFDSDGKPIYTSRREIANDIARAGYGEGTEIEYDAL